MTERSEGIPGAPVLPDGSYEALIIDASELDDGALALDVTLLDGLHKGALVTVRATGLDVDALELLALPCMLVVADKNPRVTLDGL